MSINLSEFISRTTQLVDKKSTQRVSKLSLTSKNMLGDVFLHIIPDANDLYMLVSKDVIEVHQTENYVFNGEEKKRYTTMVIPNSKNYDKDKGVIGATQPTEMQMKKLSKLYELLIQYRDLTNKYAQGGAKFDSNLTKTQMWVKADSTYSKFWAKLASVPAAASAGGKGPDTSKAIMCTHTSTNFVKAFKKWGTPDPDSDIPEADQLTKSMQSLSKALTDADKPASCIKISTTNKTTGVGFDVEIKNTNIDKYNVQITGEDLNTATPLITEDWDYTKFDDEKVDTLTSLVEDYLEQAKAGLPPMEAAAVTSHDEPTKNPFSGDAQPTVSTASVAQPQGTPALADDENVIPF